NGIAWSRIAFLVVERNNGGAIQLRADKFDPFMHEPPVSYCPSLVMFPKGLRFRLRRGHLCPIPATLRLRFHRDRGRSGPNSGGECRSDSELSFHRRPPPAPQIRSGRRRRDGPLSALGKFVS